MSEMRELRCCARRDRGRDPRRWVWSCERWGTRGAIGCVGNICPKFFHIPWWVMDGLDRQWEGVDSGQLITAPDHPAAHPGCLWSELKLGSLACTEVNVIFMNTFFLELVGLWTRKRSIPPPFSVAHLLASLCIDVIEKYTGGSLAIHREEMIPLHPPHRGP